MQIYLETEEQIYSEPEVHIFCSQRFISFAAKGVFFVARGAKLFEALEAYYSEPEVQIYFAIETYRYRGECRTFRDRHAYFKG